MSLGNILKQEDIEKLLQSEDYIKEPPQCNKKKLSAVIHNYLDNRHHINTDCTIVTGVIEDVEKLLADNK